MHTYLYPHPTFNVQPDDTESEQELPPPLQLPYFPILSGDHTPLPSCTQVTCTRVLLTAPSQTDSCNTDFCQTHSLPPLVPRD